MSKKKGPVAQKDLKTYDVEDYPYMVLFRGDDKPVYRKSHDAALTLLKERLGKLHEQLKNLGVNDAQMLITELIDQVGELPKAGGKVEGLVDPYTRTRFSAELVKRAAA